MDRQPPDIPCTHIIELEKKIVLNKIQNKKENEFLNRRIEQVARQMNTMNYSVEEIKSSFEKFRGDMENRIPEKITEKIINNQIKFLDKVYTEKLEMDSKKREFWYKLILSIFGGGGLIYLIVELLIRG
ncbi:MAG: hypothetical protein PWQ45_151 [Thermosipho sp. (in: thermotogales)]|nr:hypothetical protein [Thermosipho sp. (in: thermotogales)]